MKSIINGKYIYAAAFVLVLILLGVVIMVMRLGIAYKGGLASFTNEKGIEEINSVKKKKILSIIIKKDGESECMKVTPDGVVRIYKTCSDDLESAARLQDPKNILKLFRVLSDSDLEKLRERGSGDFYEITIQTDEGTEIIYVTDDDDDGIVPIIEDIKGDLPSPTPAPSTQASPSPLASPSPVPSPSPGFSPLPSATPQASASSQATFSCEFDENGNKRPLNVSNIICSTEPSPAP